jgi:hypothetical protein
MPCHTPLYSWTGQVVAAFPHLSRPQATVLALYSFGAILAQRCGLNSVATTLAALLGLGYLTIRSRLQEFYQPASAKSGTRRRELDVTTCFAPLLAWILKGWPSKRLALALDATSLGDRFTVLSISVVYRGSACPVAWKIVQANVRHAWKPEWITLLRSFQTLVPAGWTVVVMSDRGLYARCGTEQGFRASFEQEDGAGEGRRVLPMGRARTAVPLGTLRKTRSQIEPGMWRG